jgi:hypothetical protein
MVIHKIQLEELALLVVDCWGRWGPNHAADPIVSRWKLDEDGDPVIHPKNK